MPESRRQFVLLCHVLPEARHWDLMLDTGDALATWQLLDDPATLGGQGPGVALRARRLPDHRRAYLDYEGPVSGNRGHVARIDAGRFEVREQREDRWLIRLDGRGLSGVFRLSRAPDGLWIFEPAPEP